MSAINLQLVREFFELHFYRVLTNWHQESARADVLEYCQKLRAELRDIFWNEGRLEVELDDRDLRGGDKVWQWVKCGVPIRIEVGPRDIANDAVFLARRDTGEKRSLPRSELLATIRELLDSIQDNLFQRASAYRDERTRTIDSKDEFTEFFTPKNKEKPEIHGMEIKPIAAT